MDKLKIIRKAAEELLPDATNPGLLNGKMGGALYFHLLAKKTENMEYKELADATLDRVYKDIVADFLPVNFENGLAGIAWGLYYLKQKGMINLPNKDVLKKMDDRIYRHIGYSVEGPVGLLNGNLGYILYLLPKIRCREKHSSSLPYTLHERLMIELINRLGNSIEEREMKLEEPPSFNIAWDLPVCLWLLGEVAKTGLYDNKLERIFDQLSPVVLSLFPRLQSNRLNVGLGMLNVLQFYRMEKWQKHANLLVKSISLENMIRQELYKNNLTYLDGIAGVSAISRKMAELNLEWAPQFPAPKLFEAITSSPFWDDVAIDMLKRNNIGLLSGLMGIGLEMIYLEKHCRKTSISNINRR
jgi:hypothetical protein